MNEQRPSNSLLLQRLRTWALGEIGRQAADEIESLQRRLNDREELVDGYERQLGIQDADATTTVGTEIARLLEIERRASNEPSAELYAEVIRLREEVKGPDGFATWKDAAVSERVKRVELERRISEPPAPAHLGRGDAVRIGPNIRGEYSETMTITHVMFTLNHGAATVPDDAVVRAPSTKSEADTVMSKVRQHFDEQRDRDGYHSELERLEFAPPADPGPRCTCSDFHGAHEYCRAHETSATPGTGANQS